MKYGLFVMLGQMLTFSSWITAAEISDKRQQELIHMLRHDCGSCHGMTMKGGLGPPLTREALENKTSAQLVYTIREGHQGTAMPPWKGILATNEIVWLVSCLRKGIQEEQ